MVSTADIYARRRPFVPAEYLTPWDYASQHDITKEQASGRAAGGLLVTPDGTDATVRTGRFYWIHRDAVLKCKCGRAK